MARVTVEDCVEKLPNRFELVMLAAQRARQISSGSSLTLDRDNDKNPVVALREIAQGTVITETLKEELTRSYQRVPVWEDEDEETEIDLMEGEEEWTSINAENAAGQENPEDGESAPADKAPEDNEPSLSNLAGIQDDEDEGEEQ